MEFYRLAEGGLDEVYRDWKLHVRTPKNFEPPSHWFMGTRSIKAEYTPLTIRCGRATRRFPDFLSLGSLDLVSDRFRDIASQLGDIDAEFLPVTLLAKTGQPVSVNPYWFMHFLDTPDLIDRQKSDIEFWSPQSELIKGIKNLSFDVSKVGGRHLFATLGLGMVFASEQLAERAKNSNLQITFTPVERVRLGAYGLTTKPAGLH